MSNKKLTRRGFLASAALTTSGLAACGSTNVSETPVSVEVEAQEAYTYPQLPVAAANALYHILTRDYSESEVFMREQALEGSGVEAVDLDRLNYFLVTGFKFDGLRNESTLSVLAMDESGEDSVPISIRVRGDQYGYTGSFALQSEVGSYSEYPLYDDAGDWRIGFEISVNGRDYRLQDSSSLHNSSVASPMYGLNPLKNMKPGEDGVYGFKEVLNKFTVDEVELDLTPEEVQDMAQRVEAYRTLFEYIRETVPNSMVEYAQKNTQ